jgi:hypothetical protein
MSYSTTIDCVTAPTTGRVMMVVLLRNEALLSSLAGLATKSIPGDSDLKVAALYTSVGLS